MPKQPPESGPLSIKTLQRLAFLLDDQFQVPFTRIRLGWDFIIGLIPVAGDLLTAIASLYILYAARHYQIPDTVKWKMFLNILIDFTVGLVPIIGDLLDAGWKANARNMKLLLAAIEERQASTVKD